VDDGSRQSGSANRPSGRPSHPNDRATPVADPGAEYGSYIGATSPLTRNTLRINDGDLVKLVDQTRRTGATKRSDELVAAIDQGLLHKSAAHVEPPVPEVPAPRVRPRRVLAVIGVLAVITSAALWSLLHRAEPEQAPMATIEPQAAPNPGPPPGETSRPAAARASSPPPSLAETEAREALERLRAGLGECIRKGIHSLPGTSPAVPSSLAATKGRAFAPALAEWKTAVWSCARFRVAGPMSFQVQWQLVKAGAEGLAVAWIDVDGDGAADRALGFHITLGPKGEPVVGDVAPLPATHPVLVVR
jgi:hypothetical protein